MQATAEYSFVKCPISVTVTLKAKYFIFCDAMHFIITVESQLSELMWGKGVPIIRNTYNRTFRDQIINTMYSCM